MDPKPSKALNNKPLFAPETTYFEHVMARLQAMRGRQKYRNNVRSSIEFMDRIRKRGVVSNAPTEHNHRWKPGTTFDARPHLAGLTDLARITELSKVTDFSRIERDALHSPVDMRLPAAHEERVYITPVAAEPKRIAAFPAQRMPIDLDHERKDDSVVLVACSIVNDIQNLLVR